MSTTDAPVPESPWPSAPPGSPGLKMGFPGAHEMVLPARRFSHRAMIVLLGAGLGVLTLTLVVVALLATPGPAPYCKPLKCQGPPVRPPHGGVTGQSVHGPALENGTLYTNSQGFSLRYFPQPRVQTNSYGIGLTYYFNGGTAYLIVEGGPAKGTSPESAVADYINQYFPNAQPVYQLPDPLIGYHPAFGEAFDVQPASTSGSTQTIRLIVCAAAYNGFGILVIADGNLLPTVTSKSNIFNGHPSPANLILAYFYGTDSLMDSITFPGGG